jgi:hypothetical protein
MYISSEKRALIINEVSNLACKLGLENTLSNDLLEDSLYKIFGRCLICYGWDKRYELSETRKDLSRASKKKDNFSKKFVETAKILCHKCEQAGAPIPSIFT